MYQIVYKTQLNNDTMLPAVHDHHTRVEHKKTIKLECEPMPNVTVVLPNISGALCSTPQSLADAHY